MRAQKKEEALEESNCASVSISVSSYVYMVDLTNYELSI